MTDFSTMLQPDKGQPARTIHMVDKAGFDDWIKAQPERARVAVAAGALKPEGYAHAILPGDGPDDWSVVTVTANVNSLSSWCLAKLAAVLPPGTYRLAAGEPGIAMFGWASAQHRFTRYKRDTEHQEPRTLLSGDPVRIGATIAEVAAVCMVRDLVDTPASDMGPAELEGAAHALAKAHKAQFHVTKGDALAAEFPLVHAVGKAAARDRSPRVIEIKHGREGAPLVAIIGKGVTFDSGGLDIKAAAGMALMKKDMGGAAHALALASLVLQSGLPVRLHLIIPAAENSIAGEAMRPGDVLTSRKGLSVEIDNTDAEGRLILADALTLAGESAPDIILDFATLTGAARVALGPDLPPLFANDDALADAILAGGALHDDPLWRMPLWGGYDEMLKSDIADLTNSPSGGFAGAITAALFLRRFVSEGTPWAHIDTFAWRPTAKPGRAKGGAALGLRACWAMLNTRYRVR
ncbi:MAG: leucyl aminopeptidase family protein [Pseudomonadota bacterium]